MIPEGPITTKVLLELWPSILDQIQAANRMAWIVVVAAQVRELDGDVLTLAFSNEKDAASFRPQKGVSGGVHEILREAVAAHTGVTVKFRIAVEGAETAPISTVTAPVATQTEGWDVVAIPGSEPVEEPAPEPEAAAVEKVEQDLPPAEETPAKQSLPKAAKRSAVPDDQRFGESVVREMLGATFISEESTAPIPVPGAAESESAAADDTEVEA